MKDIFLLKSGIIGLASGLICGMFSAGGGLILVPAFTYIFNLEEKEARATSIFSILPMVITSAIFYSNKNLINWNLGIKVAVGGMMGAIVGSIILKKISPNFLKITFIIFLIYMGIKNIYY